jgi:hypothetical protein
VGEQHQAAAVQGGQRVVGGGRGGLTSWRPSSVLSRGGQVVRLPSRSAASIQRKDQYVDICIFKLTGVKVGQGVRFKTMKLFNKFFLF